MAEYIEKPVRIIRQYMKFSSGPAFRRARSMTDCTRAARDTIPIFRAPPQAGRD